MADGNGSAAPEPPAGYTEIGAEFEGWWKPIEGEPLHGKIVGFEQVENPQNPAVPRYVYVVQLLSSVTAVPVGEKEPETFEAGRIVAADEKKALESLRPYVENRCEVWVLPIGTVRTKSGNTFWRFKKTVKGRAGAIPPIVVADEATANPGGF